MFTRKLISLLFKYVFIKIHNNALFWNFNVIKSYIIHLIMHETNSELYQNGQK